MFRIHKDIHNQENTKSLKWITGIKNVWNNREINILLRNIDLRTVGSCLIISENKAFKIDHTGFDRISITKTSPQEFTQFKLKKDRKTESHIIPRVSKKYDLIIIDECNTIGGNTVLTSALKILVRQSITQKGYIVMKSYFDPVLEKNKINKQTKEIFVSSLKLQEEYIILCDNYDKISSLNIYAKTN